MRGDASTAYTVSYVSVATGIEWSNRCRTRDSAMEVVTRHLADQRAGFVHGVRVVDSDGGDVTREFGG